MMQIEKHFLYSVGRPNDVDWWLGADAESIQLLRALELGVNMYSHWSQEPNHKYQITDQFAGISLGSLFTYDIWWNTLSRKTRNMVRKAEKNGVTVERIDLTDELLGAIYEIYNESPTRQGKPFVGYGWDIKKLSEDRKQSEQYYPQGAEYLVARYEGKIIAYIHLVYSRELVLFNEVMGLLRHRNTAAMNLLISEAVKIATEKELQFIMYGKMADNDLGRFKKHNGFEKIIMYRYFSPVTTWGYMVCDLRLFKLWYYGGRLKNKILRTSKSFIRKYLGKIKRKFYKPKTYPVHILDECETIASFFTAALEGKNDIQYFYNYEKKRKFKEVILVDDDLAGTRVLAHTYSSDWEYITYDAFEQAKNIYLDKKKYDLVNCDIWISMIPTFLTDHLLSFLKICNKYLVVTIGKHTFETMSGLELTTKNISTFLTFVHNTKINVIELKNRNSSWDGGVYWMIIKRDDRSSE